MSPWRASPATASSTAGASASIRNALDPRPDTETLIEAALAIVDRQGWREQPLRLLDLGTGTGCILITLLAELPRARGIGTDHQPRRARLRRRQCRAASASAPAPRFIAADWLDARRRRIRPDPLQPALHRLRRDRRARRRRGGLRPASCARWRPRRARRLPAHRRRRGRGRWPSKGGFSSKSAPTQADAVAEILRAAGLDAARAIRQDLGRQAARGCGRVVTGGAGPQGRRPKKGLENRDVRVRFTASKRLFGHWRWEARGRLQRQQERILVNLD